MNVFNNIDINIIKWIQNNLSSNILDYIMYSLTHLGDKYIFILIAVILYWTVNKKFAFKLTLAFIASAAVNTVLKNIFVRPRPYTQPGIDSVFTKTHGYSFPSGHSQASGALFYGFNHEYGKTNKLVRYLAVGLLVIIPLTRMYLGQHYLTDVLIGSIIGILAVFLGFKLFDLMGDKEHIYPLFLIPVFLIILVVLYPKDYGNVKDIFVASGGYVGFVIGYAIEKIYIKHNVETTFTNKVLKVIIGLAIVAAVYFGLSFIFKSIKEESLIFDFIRYVAIALAATTAIPYIFTKVFKQTN